MTKSIGVILAGEIGPNETRLAFCGLDMGRPVLVVDERIPTKSTPSLGAAVHRFVKKHRPPQLRTAAFAVTGPVHDGACLAANLPWPIEAAALASELALDRLRVLNDVEAVGHAVQTLLEEDLVTVHRGDPPEYGNQAVLSAGTCPAMAGLLWNGTEHRSFGSDGAHADFAPATERELALLDHLQSQVARVTVELVLSDAGLELVHRFVCKEAGATSEPLDAAAIIARGTKGDDRLCRGAIDLFLSVFGSAAGNLALTLRATGGVYLAGSLVAALREELRRDAFLTAFSRKAPMQPLLQKIPVSAIVSDQAALLGAASVAVRDMRVLGGGGWAS